MSLILLGILNSQAAAAGGAGAYDLLETQVLGTTTASVTFTGLDSYTDYKHLQLRMTQRSTNAASNSDSFEIRFNADTGSNYAHHRLRAFNGSVTSAASTSQTALQLHKAVPLNNEAAGIFGASVVDILDFSNTSKNTTIRALSGAVVATNAEKVVVQNGGVWLNTAAVTSITILYISNNFSAGSRFSLYGIKGA